MKKAMALALSILMNFVLAIIAGGFTQPGSEVIAQTLPVGETKSARTHSIVMSNKEPYYQPQSLTIDAGDSVRWVNSEQSDPHSVHERSGVMISPDVMAASEWCYTFTRAGEYNYTCRIHPWMRGKIIVKPRSIDVSTTALNREFQSPVLITNPSDNSVWLLNAGSNGALARISPSGSIIRQSLAGNAKLPANICFDSNGNLWGLETVSGSIVAFDAATGSAKKPAAPLAEFKPSAIAASANGVIWIFDAASKQFVSFDVKTGRVEKLPPVELNAVPVIMVADRLGKLWFIEESRTRAGVYDPNRRKVEEFPMSDDAQLAALITGVGNDVWLSDPGRNKIIRIDKDWVSEYTVPTSYSLPLALTVDDQGAVWFVENRAGMLGRLRDGRFDEFSIPISTNSPVSLAIDGSGNLWVADGDASRMSMIKADTLRALNDSTSQASCSSVSGAEKR